MRRVQHDEVRGSGSRLCPSPNSVAGAMYGDADGSEDDEIVSLLVALVLPPHVSLRAPTLSLPRMSASGVYCVA
eukprot:2635114-Pyramimonas_sp.AAC.1